MNPSEIVFLALGLVLGAAIGAAVLEAVRARPTPRHEVRVTVAPNSIAARRPATLASTDLDAGRLPIPGSPDDHGWLERRLAGESTGGGYRTRVPSGPVSVPVSAIGIPVAPPPRVDVTARGPGVAPSSPGPDAFSASLAAPAIATAVLDPISPLDPAERLAVAHPATLPAHPDVGRVEPTLVVRPRPAAGDARPVLAPVVVAVPMYRSSTPPDTTPDSGWPLSDAVGEDLARALAEDPGAEPAAPAAFPAGPAPAGSPDTEARGACDDERLLVEERCRLAEAARGQARLAADALRESQRDYDVLRERVERAQVIADPREIRAAKDALHRAFRAARSSAATPEEVERVAREWLSEVNRLNTGAREATHVVDAGTAQLRALLPRLERLAVETDAARITAENAEAGCHEAREALARCEEAAALAEAAAAVPAPPEEPTARDLAWPTSSEESPVQPTPEPGGQGALASMGEPSAVVLVLRGDRAARERLVATLAAGDPSATRDWQLRIAALVDAIQARAIEDGYLDLPDTGFWGLFSHTERREIVGALSALGYRFDGLGGFADGRVPAPRDLSLAVGYAGLDRMRIRSWPREAEMPALYADADVAADEWLVRQAGDLSLGSMVDALGGRAAELADVWNAWGRVRLALLATG